MEYYKLYSQIGNLLWLGLLVFGRFLGAMSLFVLFAKRVPMFIKAVIAWIMTILVLPYFINVNLSDNDCLNLFLLVKEIAYGALIGYLLSFPIWLIEAAGNIIDIQRGEQFGAIVNQMTQNPESSIAKLLTNTFIAYFVFANGLLYMIDFILNSFTIIGITDFLPRIPSLVNYVNLVNSFFYWAIILALPVIVVMFLMDIILGLISSFIPQMNVTIMSMPLKSGVALFFMIFYLSFMLQQILSKFLILVHFI